MGDQEFTKAHGQILRLPAAISRRKAVGALVVIAAFSAGSRIVLGKLVPAPFVFLDELGYEQMARSFAQGGHFALYGKNGLAYSPLYPVLLSPIYALTSSATTAYGWVKVANAVLISLSLFPIYGIARLVLTRRLSLTVAALAAIAPLMSYSSLELSENLAYPLCLVAIWAMLRAVRTPGRWNDFVLLGTIVLACAARLQLIVLVPVALTAILIVALLEPADSTRRRGAVAHALGQHRLLLGVLGALGVAALARTIANNGSLPLAGRYSIVGTARPQVLHVLELIVHHVAGLDLAVGVLPFACAVLTTYCLARAGFPHDGLVFGAVAAGMSAWLLLEVGLDAATYDTGKSRLPSGQSFGDLPRIHERYLIYVVPFFLIALVAAVHLVGRTVPLPVHIAIAAGAALLPAVIPYAQDINESVIADSPGLQLLADVKAGKIVPVANPVLTAVIAGSVLSVVYLVAFMARHRPLAMVVTVAVTLAMSAAYAARVVSTGNGSLQLNLSSHGDWVDRTGVREVALISGKPVRRVALLETAFFNLSISRLYYVCWTGFEPNFGERQLVVGSDGRLGDSTGPLRVRFAVVPTRFEVTGRILSSDRRGRLELIAPANGFLTVPQRSRSRLGCQ